MPKKKAKPRPRLDLTDSRRLKEISKDLIINFCIEMLDYSPDSLNELYDSLQATKELIHRYVETTSSFSGELRREIIALAFDADILYMTFNELYIESNGIIYQVKRQCLLEEPVKLEKKVVEDFLRKFKKARKELRTLVQRTRAYIEKVKTFPGPMPIA